MLSLTQIAKSLAKKLPPVRRLVAERDDLRRTVRSLRKRIAKRAAADQAAANEAEPLGWMPPLALSQEHIRQDARLFADRRTALTILPKKGRVAEVGVAYGDFSEILLSDLDPICFHAYDLFPWEGSEIVWGKPTREIFRGKTHKRFYEERFSKQIVDGTVAVFQGDSKATLAAAPDDFYDVIYIDAGHSYDSVSADAEIAKLKLRKNGFLVFNDYLIYNHRAGETFGIVWVVNQMCVEDGWEIVYLALQNNMFCDIGLQRRNH